MVAKQITCHRVYEEPWPKDGKRVLVDRVWPRGMRKEDAHLDEWLRDVAPSTEPRRWYSHEPSRFAEFRRELLDSGHQPAVEHLRELAAHDKITLLTASEDSRTGSAEPVLARSLLRLCPDRFRQAHQQSVLHDRRAGRQEQWHSGNRSDDLMLYATE